MSDIIERAFELARSGDCRTLEELKKLLSRESHMSVEQHMAGSTIRKQLNGILRERRRSAAKGR